MTRRYSEESPPFLVERLVKIRVSTAHRLFPPPVQLTLGLPLVKATRPNDYEDGGGEANEQGQSHKHTQRYITANGR